MVLFLQYFICQFPGNFKHFFLFVAVGLTPPKINPGNKKIRITDEGTSEVEILVGTKLTVISETLVKVRCDISTEPAPAVSWEIQEKIFDFRDTVSLSEDNSTLTLSDPGREDSGVYKCTASNNVGQDSKSSTINILRKY